MLSSIFPSAGSSAQPLSLWGSPVRMDALSDAKSKAKGTSRLLGNALTAPDLKNRAEDQAGAATDKIRTTLQQESAKAHEAVKGAASPKGGIPLYSGQVRLSRARRALNLAVLCHLRRRRSDGLRSDPRLRHSARCVCLLPLPLRTRRLSTRR